MTIQTFKLGRSEEYLEGLSEGYSSGYEAGLRASLYVLRKHQYDDDITIKDMADILEEFLNKAEANRIKRNKENDNDSI